MRSKLSARGAGPTLTTLACLAAALLGLAGGAADARPSVRVMARPTVSVVAQHQDGQTVIRGELRDDVLDTGLGGRAVRVSVEHARGEPPPLVRTVRTGADGFFRLHVDGCDQDCRISASFAGDGYFAAAQRRSQKVRRGPRPLQLSLRVPAVLDGRRRRQQISLRAISVAGDMVAPVAVLRGQRVLATVQRVGQEPVAVAVPTRALGAPGGLELVARFAGNATYAAAASRAQAVLNSPVTVTLAVNVSEISSDGVLLAGGTVRDLGGAVEGTVRLHALGRRVASARSDAQGRFEMRLSAHGFPPGDLDLRAEFVPAVAWRYGAKSVVRHVQVLGPPRPPTTRVFVTSAGITLALLAALAAGRFYKGWDLRRWWRQGRLAKPVELPRRPPETGLEVQPLALSARRRVRKRLFSVAGVVVDGADGGPLEGAVLSLGDPAGLRVTTGTKGRFALDQLHAGAHAVTARFAGYVEETVLLRLPHRGELTDMQIRLLPIRLRVLEMYRDATLELLPHRFLWARWTPRDLLEHLSRQRVDQGDIERLSDVLERAYWSAPVADPQLLDEAKTIVTRLARRPEV